MPSFGDSDFFPNAKQIVESCLPLSILGGRTFSNELFEERPLYVWRCNDKIHQISEDRKVNRPEEEKGTTNKS